MPCNSDHLEPSSRESYNQETARCYEHAVRSAGFVPGPAIIAAAKNAYCSVDYTAELCAFLNAQPASFFEDVVYNGRIAASRRLADWWDRHGAADAARRARERQQQEDEKLIESARSKLTPEELSALIRAYQ